MKTLIDRTVTVNEATFIRCDYTVTNKLKCTHCNKRINKGSAVLLTYTEGKFHSANCGSCREGAEELYLFQQEIFHVDVEGIGQY